MTLFGLAWSSEDRLEEAAAAYVAAIGLAEVSEGCTGPSIFQGVDEIRGDRTHENSTENRPRMGSGYGKL